jgi:hypothetical protein
MTSIQCKCGARIGTGSFPNPDAFKAISESRYDSIQNGSMPSPLEALFFGGVALYRCPTCHRLIVEWEKAGLLTFYKKEA